MDDIRPLVAGQQVEDLVLDHARRLGDLGQARRGVPAHHTRTESGVQIHFSSVLGGGSTPRGAERWPVPGTSCMDKALYKMWVSNPNRNPSVGSM